MVDPVPSEQWEQHKKEILRLYIDEDLPLKHVMKRVRTRDFHPDESQYRSKLKTWGQRKARKSHKAKQTPAESKQAFTSAQLSQQWESSGDLHSNLRGPAFSHFDQPDPNWAPIPTSCNPPVVFGPTAADPHAEISYSDQQIFPHESLRRSFAEVTQSSPGQPRVERAVRQRALNSYSKGSPPIQAQNQYSSSLGYPGPLGTATENQFEVHPPLVLQYPPANPETDLGWWQ